MAKGRKEKISMKKNKVLWIVLMSLVLVVAVVLTVFAIKQAQQPTGDPISEEVCVDGTTPEGEECETIEEESTEGATEEAEVTQPTESEEEKKEEEKSSSSSNSNSGSNSGSNSNSGSSTTKPPTTNPPKQDPPKQDPPKQDPPKEDPKPPAGLVTAYSTSTGDYSITVQSQAKSDGKVEVQVFITPKSSSKVWLRVDGGNLGTNTQYFYYEGGYMGQRLTLSPPSTTTVSIYVAIGLDNTSWTTQKLVTLVWNGTKLAQ